MQRSTDPCGVGQDPAQRQGLLRLSPSEIFKKPNHICKVVFVVVLTTRLDRGKIRKRELDHQIAQLHDLILLPKIKHLRL